MDNRLPHNLAVQGQQDRLHIRVREQAENSKGWKSEESYLVGRTIFVDSFTTSSRNFPNWEAGSLEKTPVNWVSLTAPGSQEGLELRETVLRSVPLVSLRSLGCELKTTFTMYGSTTVHLMTRSLAFTDSDSVICKISKDKYSQRVFVTLGTILDITQDFMLFRKQEIPESKLPGPDDDSCQIQVALTDNGDSSIWVSVTVNNDILRQVTMSSNKFVPTFNPTRVIIAAMGELAVFKFIALKYIERFEAGVSKPNHHEECCSLL